MNLTLFKYENQEIRMEEHEGQRWWIALDVCKILEIKNATNALRNLHDDEKGLLEVKTLGGTQRLSCVTEPGLYKLIMKSKKPEAVAFQRWFTHEVLPSINHTGAYVAPTTSQVVQSMSNDPLVQQCEMLLAVVKRQSTIEAQVTETKQIVTEMKQVASEALKVAEEVKESTRHDNGYMHVSSYARKLKVYIDTEHSKKIGMELSKYCRQNGIEIHKIDHPYYPQGVNAYPTEVLDMHKYLFVSP